MAGVLDNVTVLDLSSGIAGPLTGMLLADNGAAVTRIELPAGDPWSDLSGYRVWQRGKRRAQLDLRDPGDREVLVALARTADVLIESFPVGVTEELGIDYETLRAVNPRLVYCSITGYGTTGPLARRPAIEALVAARTGQMWEARGIEGGTIAKLAGVEGPLPGVTAPDGLMVGAPRPGPLFGGVPWLSMGAFYLASIAISAALRVREVTGRGQHVHTSLLQGALVSAIYPWQRAERPETDGYQSWVIDPRAPKGFFRCADGRWIHQWAPLPSFMLGSSTGSTLGVTEEVTAPKQAGMRIALGPEEMLLLHHFIPPMAEAAAKFSSAEWTAFAAKVGVPLQPIRSPEEALDDPSLLADGCVVEIDDPELGPVRQVGVTYHLSACPTAITTGPAALGAHTEDVRREAATAASAPPVTAPPLSGTTLSSPLEGLLVLDVGLAAAGPYGAQILGQLGARVVKVQQKHDGYWMGNHIGLSVNMGKQSLGIDLKRPEGMAIFHQLVARADIVHTNMRYGALERLGIDYESLRAVNPRLIYCHTRGFERGERDLLPGNDQTGAALAGTDWLDGGLDDGGMPIWSNTSLGDTGNGLLSAVACVQAVYHRDRTGQGQFVDTSIIYAHLLNASMAWKTADGTVVADRPSLDAMQLGWGPLYRLYATADEWLCIAADCDDAWRALCDAIGEPGLAADARFATRAARRANAGALAAHLETVFATRPAAAWFDALDAAGVPCEIAAADAVLDLFADPELRERQWIATYEHPVIGRLETAGLLMDFSETPGILWGPAPLVGQHTRQILTELGYEKDAIDELVQLGVVAATD